MASTCPVCIYLMQAISRFNLEVSPERRIHIQPLSPRYGFVPENVRQQIKHNVKPFSPDLPMLIFDDFIIFIPVDGASPNVREFYYLLKELDGGG